MKTIKQSIKKLSHTYRIIILICACVIGSFCIGKSYAAYVSRSYVKGVAASPKQAINLSSDYLSVVSQSVQEANFPARRIVLDKKSDTDTSPYSISFYIENTNGGTVSTKRIEYQIRIKGLLDNEGNLPEGIKIYYNDSELSADKLNAIFSDAGFQPDAMPAYADITHYYKIEIPKDKIDDISDIVVVAVPTVESDSSGNMLAARIQPSTIGVVAAFSYQSSFPDKTVGNHPYDFAAFNYEISVNSATTDHTMVLTWDKDKLEIDPSWGTNSGSVEIIMNGDNSHYLVKFYRLVGRNQNDSWQQDWTAMETIISFAEKTN